MIKPEWYFMRNKKQTTDQRLKRIETAIGELYIMIHHIAERLEPETDKKED